MNYTPDNAGYCGNCRTTFTSDIYYCPKCKSNIIEFDTKLFTKLFAGMKWDRHNKNFQKPSWIIPGKKNL